MQTIISIVLAIIVFLGSSYFFWKQLKEDYIPVQIFSSTNIFFIGIIIIFLLMRIFNLFLELTPLVYALFFIGFIIVSQKKGMKSFEVYEAITPSVLLIFLFLFTVKFIFYFQWYFLAGMIASLVSLAIYVYLRIGFMRFVWYPSGRIGVSSVISIAILSLQFLILELFSSGKLLFTENVIDLFIFLFIMVFNLFTFLWLKNKK